MAGIPGQNGPEPSGPRVCATKWSLNGEDMCQDRGLREKGPSRNAEGRCGMGYCRSPKERNRLI